MKKLLILLIAVTAWSCSSGDKHTENSGNAIPAVKINEIQKTVLLQSANSFNETVFLSYPFQEDAEVMVTSDNPDILINGGKSASLKFSSQNYNTPQPIHIATTNKLVTNVCYGKEFNLHYTLISGSEEAIAHFPDQKGYIIQDSNEFIFKLNPNGNAPLSATANIVTNEKTTISYNIMDKDNPEQISVTNNFAPLRNDHDINIFGLFDNSVNYIDITAKKEDGSLCFSQRLVVKTENIDLPGKNMDGSFGIVSSPLPDNVENSWFLIDARKITESGFVYHKLLVDLKGNIRWVVKDKFFSTPVKFIPDTTKSGNDMIEVMPLNSNGVYYYDMAGKLITDKNITNLFLAHHDLVNIPNSSNILIFANLRENKYYDDTIMEYDTVNKSIIKTYNMGKIMPIDRRVNIVKFIDLKEGLDWLHLNSIDYDNQDNGVILSGRHQGVVKVNRDFSEVKWIIAPHLGWNGKNVDGNPVDLSNKLLTPLKPDGTKITDKDVLEGRKADESGFDWTWGQHNAKILEKNGSVLTLIVYDNGDNRQQRGEKAIGYYDPNGYSRTVIYEIDEDNMTIKQIWEAGKNKGAAAYSQIMSNSEKLSNGNIQMHSAFVIENNLIEPHSAYFEYDYNNSNEPIYTYTLPNGISSYRIYKVKPFDVMAK